MDGIVNYEIKPLKISHLDCNKIKINHYNNNKITKWRIPFLKKKNSPLHKKLEIHTKMKIF